MKYLAILVMVFGINAANAATVVVDGKTYYSEQTAAAKTTETIDTISKYAMIGEQFGSAFAATAKELGIAVNDFAKTDTGRLATWLIMYKLIGRDIIHYVLGSLWLIGIGFIWFYVMRRTCIIQSVTKSYDEKGKVVNKVVYRDESGDAGFVAFISGLIILGGGTAILFG